VSGSGISWTICKSAPRSRQITTPEPHHSVFYRPDALPAAQPTASKHWKHILPNYTCCFMATTLKQVLASLYIWQSYAQNQWLRLTLTDQLPGYWDNYFSTRTVQMKQSGVQTCRLCRRRHRCSWRSSFCYGGSRYRTCNENCRLLTTKTRITYTHTYTPF